jgi:hypothetical protein
MPYFLFCGLLTVYALDFFRLLLPTPTSEPRDLLIVLVAEFSDDDGMHVGSILYEAIGGAFDLSLFTDLLSDLLLHR